MITICAGIGATVTVNCVDTAPEVAVTVAVPRDAATTMISGPVGAETAAATRGRSAAMTVGRASVTADEVVDHSTPAPSITVPFAWRTVARTRSVAPVASKAMDDGATS